MPASIKRPSKTKLIDSLKAAAEKKSTTPIGKDADQRRYGLFPKRFYIEAFGSWNEGIKQAGLPVNEWRAQQGRNRQPRFTRSHNGAYHGPDRRVAPLSLAQVKSFLAHKLEVERREIETLEHMLEECQDVEQLASVI